MATEGGRPIPERLTAPVGGVRSGPRKLVPVSDEVFASILAMGAYDPGPLDATVDARDESPEHWIVETVSFTAAYGDERVPAYLPPAEERLAAVPGGALRATRERQPPAVARRPAAGRQSVRAPLRAQRPRRPLPRQERHLRPPACSTRPGCRREAVSDLNRSIDYLESRSDIDGDRIAYFAVSSISGAYFARPGFERIKALVMVAAGIPSVPCHLTATRSTSRRASGSRSS